MRRFHILSFWCLLLFCTYPATRAGAQISSIGVNKYSDFYVKERVRQIYNEVSKAYKEAFKATLEGDTAWQMPDIRRFLSSEFKIDEYKVYQYDSLHCPDFKGYDYLDYWIQHMEPEGFDYEICSVNVIDGFHAEAELAIGKPYNYSLTLTLLYEDSDWYIDDFRRKECRSERERMEYYVRTGGKNMPFSKEQITIKIEK